VNRRRQLLLGIAASNAAGLILCASAYFLSFNPLGDLVVALPSFMLIPIFMGAIAAWYWRPLNLTTRQTVGYTAVITLVGIAASVIVFGEGTICLLMLSPILYAGVLAGTLISARWHRKKRDRLNAYLAPLIAFAIIAEPSFRQPLSSVVTDEIHIAAPPSKVWPHLLAFKPISARPDYWLFHLGLPYPVETTNQGDFVGADRACIFSGGAVFKEKITEFQPERLLTFEIVEQPPDPELLGHLDARRGQFELRANNDGSTTLIGRTWYTLHVRPAWYFDWWTHDIFSAVHLRVMNNVKSLAESTP
jgi:hypothetical protein